MKAVLMSIQPEWCQLIASGKKTLEVRKTRPKSEEPIEEPFKVYIYCTANKQGTKDLLEIHATDGKIHKANSKVIGEFVCDNIFTYYPDPLSDHSYLLSDEDFEETCFTLFDEFWEYGKGATLYGWHISDLKIYEKPKELSDFSRFCDGISGKKGCKGCEYYYEENNESIGHYEACGCDNLRPLRRPPQSWCYVEEPQE